MQYSDVKNSLKLDLMIVTEPVIIVCWTYGLQFDWYTKRASLAMVYTSAEVYMTQDSSPEFEKTSEFVQRQLACCDWVGQCLGEVS